MNRKQKKRKIEPRIKLNYNMYMVQLNESRVVSPETRPYLQSRQSNPLLSRKDAIPLGFANHGLPISSHLLSQSIIIIIIIVLIIIIMIIIIITEYFNRITLQCKSSCLKRSVTAQVVVITIYWLSDNSKQYCTKKFWTLQIVFDPWRGLYHNFLFLVKNVLNSYASEYQGQIQDFFKDGGGGGGGGVGIKGHAGLEKKKSYYFVMKKR